MANVKDPVCGMTIDSMKAAAKSTYQGQTYYFCSTECKTDFDQHPAQYAETGAASGSGRGKAM